MAAFFAFLLAGFGLKAGVFPLGQLWLPDAHSIAPSPVSALLSGVMLKTGIYGLMRTSCSWPRPGIAAFDGRTWGLGHRRDRRGDALHRHHPVDEAERCQAAPGLQLDRPDRLHRPGHGRRPLLGTAGEPALRALALVAVVGALFHVLNHAIFKGLLFLTSGSILYATGTKDLNKLGGLIRLMPVSAVVAGIASLSISGMPPFSGFASKWTIISSSLLAGDATVVLVLFGIVALFTSAVTLACYVKFFGMAFTSSGSEWSVGRTIREVPGSMLAPKLVLTAVALVQGLFPVLFVGLVLKVLERSEGFLLAARRRRPGPRPLGRSCWACG